MPVTLSRNFGSLADLALVAADDMREIGLLARERIIRRTSQGLDADGRAFKPYSAAYAAFKRATLGTGGTVDLTVSGNMLNQLQIVALTDHSVTLGWNQ